MIENNSSPVYTHMSEDEIKGRMRDIQRGVKSFCKDFRFPYKNIDLDLVELSSVVRCVGKRREHYRYFHNNMCINECKEAALLAYWILKFKPLRFINRSSKRDRYINEKFAFYIIITSLSSIDVFTKDAKVSPSSYYRKVIYSFRYRCVTIDSMLLLVESISPGTFSSKHQ